MNADELTLSAPRTASAVPAAPKVVNHSYEGLMEGLAGGIFPGVSPWLQTPITQPNTLQNNSSGTPISMNRQLLNYAYLDQGIVQTLIDQPVDDAFKGGIIIKCDELDEKDMRCFQRYLRRHGTLAQIKQGIKWGRLFGGGGLLIATDQDPATPFNIDSIGENDRVTFVPIDRWELTNQVLTPNGYAVPQPYYYYSQRVDYSRIIRIMGRPAPSLIRYRLSGWGMSELERCLADINQFVQLRTVIFELVNQAKIDVLKLEGLNNLLTTADGTNKAIMRVMIANMIKSYKAALVLDMGDDYEQKTQTFSGLADLLEQAMICLSAATRIPVPKLFGVATTGFGSGEDQLENYNALVESDVREKNIDLIETVLSVSMQHCFGYVPDFDFEFYPLREVDPLEEEQIKTSKQARVLALRTADQISGEEADEVLHKEGLLDIDTEVGRGEREPSPDWMQGVGEAEGGGDDDPPSKPVKKPPAEDHSREGMRQKYVWLRQQMTRGSFRRWYAKTARETAA